MTHGKTYNKSSRRINYKATKSKTNTGTTALERLNEWAEKYQVYVEAWAGFRKGMGTIDNIFILHCLVSHCVNENMKLFASFIDLKKKTPLISLFYGTN